MKLTIELVPKTSWYTNVRSNISKEQWDKLRNECYTKAHYKCEVCGGKGHKWPVECHEVWEYDDVNHIQKLARLIALCPNCHTTKHPGLAAINGKHHIVMSQLTKINNMTDKEAAIYLEKCFEIWRERSKHEWILDISFIKNKL